MTQPNFLFYGDNLDVLRNQSERIPSQSVDLIYLDPPFNSNQDYNAFFTEPDGSRSGAQIKAFTDTWRWDDGAEAAYEDVVERGGLASLAMQGFRKMLEESDLMAYLAMMAPRLKELHRVLKPTGSLYLHCDPSASHYLKQLLDAIFTPSMFRSEIIWKRTSAHSSAKRWGPVHDVILYYTKTDRYTWNPVYLPLPQETLDQWYNNVDAVTGKRFNRADLTAPGIRHGSSGLEWRGVNPTDKGRHWAIPGFVTDVVAGLDTIDALDALQAAGRIHWPAREGGMPMVKRYVEESKGIPAQDVITDIYVNNISAERLGYPTQKPEALLDRIVRASSNAGDTVLDPFCGCGTAVAVAHRLGRRWVGIDITLLATNLIKTRLQDAFGTQVAETYRVIGEPVTLDEAAGLAKTDPYQFQWWALGLAGARREEEKKGADKGIDGRLYFHDDNSGKSKQIIFSVKAGKLQAQHVRDLRGVLDRESAQIGVLLSMDTPTPKMRAEAASAGLYTAAGWDAKYPRMQLLTIEDLLDGRGVQAPQGRANVTFRKAQRAKSTAANLPMMFVTSDVDADE